MKRKWWYLSFLMVLMIFMAGCVAQNDAVQEDVDTTPPSDEIVLDEAVVDLAGELIVYHAGSLAVPFEKIEMAFETMYPEVDVIRTSGGSRDITRKVSEFEDAVDVLASADYNVIETMLVPEYASWDALFANNSMVIMYSKDSKYADEIDSDNWYEILLRDGVNFGYSAPNADPCGYRSLLVWQLAEKHYDVEGLNAQLEKATQEKNIRPKSVELIAMLETGALDYAFEYESVAMQHIMMNPEMNYVALPNEINLSAVEFRDFYAQASVELNGSEPGTTVTTIAEPIVYGLTMPATGKNSLLAEAFIKFLFDNEGGMEILLEAGQPVLDQVLVLGGENLPEGLKYLNK
ncbi:MAG: substrate-binding domain-containing protein [Clostridiales bacterium]|nr:substrate-binding domain-containing protein [Clostridiales bacterium]